jgi:DNA-binding response OmpR family regulator
MSLERYNLNSTVTIEVADTVSMAKEIFNPSKHIVALIDWNLPDGEGIDVANYIRKTHSTFPIVLLSSTITDDNLVKAKTVNPTLCLEKDYSKEFIEKLHLIVK